MRYEGGQAILFPPQLRFSVGRLHRFIFLRFREGRDNINPFFFFRGYFTLLDGGKPLRKGIEMAKEIVIDCVVKPILSVAVTMASMVVFGFVSKKIEDRRNKKAEAEREEPEMA